MRPEDVVVQGVVDYFSSAKYDRFSKIEKRSIQMGSESREADVVLIDRNGKFAAIIECKRSGYEGRGVPQLKSYLSATNTPLGIFANETTPTDWKFYENRGQNQFKQINHSRFERKLLKTNIIGTLRKWWERLFPPQRIINCPSSLSNLLADQNADKELTTTKQLYLEYWTAFGEYLEQRNGVMKPRTPQPEQWISAFTFEGARGCALHPKVKKTDGWIRASVYTPGKRGEDYFHLLKQDKAKIEAEIGDKLKWENKEENSTDRFISLYLCGVDLEDRQDWGRQHGWLCEQLETFHEVFAPRIEVLNAIDYRPEENNDTCGG